MNREAQRLERLRAQLADEERAIERLGGEIAAASSRIRGRDPDWIERRALASLVHDLYVAAERLFLHVSKELDGGPPTGPDWHRDLLKQAGMAIERARPALIPGDLVQDLAPYLGFRHLVCNIYGFEIDWARLRPLVENAPERIARLRSALAAFDVFLGDLVTTLAGD